MSGKSSSNGTSFWWLLALLFIGLKLAGYIDWPWLLVIGPLWIPTAIGLFIVAAFAVGGAIALAVSFVGMLILDWWENRRTR